MVPVSKGDCRFQEPRRNPPHGSGPSFGHPPRHALRHAGLRRAGDGEPGVYHLADSSPLSNPDMVTVAARVPGGVICLISALAFHEITTQIPHEVHVALPRGAEEPRLDHPPIKTYRFTGEAYTEGVEPMNSTV
jgi:predicted transcriptional regulator of viral defense system